MNDYRQKSFRPIFLSFLNRELKLLRRVDLTDAEIAKFVKLAALITSSEMYAPFAQAQEMLHHSSELISLSSNLCKIQKLNLINQSNDFEGFLETRREMYHQRRDLFSCYFTGKQPMRDLYRKSENLDTSKYIKKTLLGIAKGEFRPNWIDGDEVVRLIGHQKYIADRIQEDGFAATYSKYEIEGIQPHPQEARFFGDLSTKLFKFHYSGIHDAVSPTGIFGDSILEDYDQYPYFDFLVNFSLLRNMELDKIVINKEYDPVFYSFITHAAFSEFVVSKNHFLYLSARAIGCSPERRRTAGQYGQYLSRLRKDTARGGQNFDPIIYCEMIASTISDIRNSDKVFAAVMEKEDDDKIKRNKIATFTATDLEDDVFSAEIINAGFQYIGQGNLGDYFCNIYSLYDTLHLYHVRSSMGSGGVHGSQRVSQVVLDKDRFDSVVALGICFGAKSEKQKLGDIIVAERIKMYELAAARNGEFQFRGDAIPTATAPVSYARNMRGRVGSYEIHVGTVLSGEKLVDDPEFKRQILKMDEKAAGGEMEAAGIVTSCFARGIPFALVKGICDFGENKDDKAQELAAENAIRFGLQMIIDVYGKKME